MRQLASIQKILALEPIPEADAIVKATVLGWQLVVKKDEFTVGELCVYVEIDAILPNLPAFEFMKARGFRVRTIRLRGQVSQGICFPLGILPVNVVVAEGADVTEALGIVKYEAPIPAQLAGIMKGNFPSFIPKTDETRVQVLQKLLLKLEGEPCVVSEKLDGTSATYFVNNNVFGVCTRNLELEETSESSLWKIARENDIESKLFSLNKNIAIQGEVVGEGVQGNKYKLKGQLFFVFSIFDIDTFRYVDFEDFIALAKQLQLVVAPILEIDYLLETNIPALVQKAIGKSVLCSSTHREGIVIRPLISKNQRQSRDSFKAINPEFLLKYE